MCYKKFKETTKNECNTRIFDCRILGVDLENKNYEGSTVTTKGNKQLRRFF